MKFRGKERSEHFDGSPIVTLQDSLVQSDGVTPRTDDALLRRRETSKLLYILMDSRQRQMTLFLKNPFFRRFWNLGSK